MITDNTAETVRMGSYVGADVGYCEKMMSSVLSIGAKEFNMVGANVGFAVKLMIFRNIACGYLRQACNKAF